MAETFRAAAQYDDWRGTAAADDADQRAIQEYLKEKGHLADGAFVVGVRAFASSHGEAVRTISVRVIIADGEGFDDVHAQITSSDRLRFKELNLEIPLGEFFSLFKRFSVVLTSRDLNLDGREYEITEDVYPDS